MQKVKRFSFYTTVARFIHINSNANIKLKLIVMSAIGVDNALS